MQDFFRCKEGYEAKADAVADKSAKKVIKDMHYEVRVQAVIQYHADIHRVRIAKSEARTMKLTREQYMQVPPWWCAHDLQCWARMVDRWCDPAWEENHNTCWERRLWMRGAPHHQGNLKLSEYSAAHGGEPCSQFKAYDLAHKGKVMADVAYNPDDPPLAYNYESVHSCLDGYTSMARAVHGPEYDPSAHDLDGEVVMRTGGGKKHGRF
ncbi:uncharacterized protein [Setaria viridis]|uniref:uncharacterized protein n=1 Tax=Setaria viridis TaxID=4556 RepID=UPI003B3B8755